MGETIESMFEVPGATLRYKTRGDGPLLLILPGGDGDADGAAALTDRLVDRFTVVSYDRRGLSRTRVDDDAPLDLATHSDDASRLLAALTDRPALVFGASFGALVGLDLLARHAGQVALLVAHEPPAPELLAEPERAEAVRAQERVEAAHRTDGVPAAMREFLSLSGFDSADREPDVELPRPRPERIANLTFFLTHDAPASRRYRLDRAALNALSDRIVPAAGQSSGGGFPHRCAHALAAELGRPLVAFPGGHSGYVLRPRAFAARLRETFDGAAVNRGPARSPDA